MTKQEQAIEFWRCRKNPFYFIFNYVKIPETGGVIKYEPDLMNGKFRQTVRALVKYHRCILMATRQLGKSTLVAALLEHALNFFPRNSVNIINANKPYAYANLQIVKFIHENLPSFLRVPLKFHGDRKTFLEYSNGSIVRTFYPSASTTASALARSLTSPILYIDEAAHIRHIQEAYGAAQPTLSRAKEQAAKNAYPYFLAISSTPNGSEGTGQWFYDMFQYAIEADNIFDEASLFNDDADELVNNPERNGFVKVTYHWSQDSTKSQKWYDEQRRELNFDQRLINQELDLLFIGGTSCIFEDDFLSSLQTQKVLYRLRTPHQTFLNLYVDEFDVTDYLLIGVDTAKSLVGDYNAIEVFSYLNFIQIAEYFGRLGSLTKYSELVGMIAKYFIKITNGHVILCIEENSIGTAIIENLVNDSTFDYSSYIYSPDSKKRIGIYTSAQSRGIMVSALYDYLTSDSSRVKSSDLKSQLNIIERKTGGRIAAQSGKHDDLFMACALCAYVRRISELEFLPLIDVTLKDQNMQSIEQYKDTVKLLSSPNLLESETEVIIKDNTIEYVVPTQNPKDNTISCDEQDFLFTMF